MLQLKVRFVLLKVVAALLVYQNKFIAGAAGLEVGFYQKSCRNVEEIVRFTVARHYSANLKVAAAILRLHFHDCFVHGCDGSVLISSSSSERTSPFNAGLGGFEVIDYAKAELESSCPGVVSCADILALAARDAVELSGGPSWAVPTGRRDGSVSAAADTFNLPTPLDSVSILRQKFHAKGLSVADLVTLNGAHTIGRAECRLFKYRLYNYSGRGDVDPSINTNFLAVLRMQCPEKGGESKLIPLDMGSPDVFDSTFFFNVVQGNGVLESDQKILEDFSTTKYVHQYAADISQRQAGDFMLRDSFRSRFADAMVRLSAIEVKSGNEGSIRKICSVPN